MAGISSKAAGKIENKKNKFQGQEYNGDFDVNLYEFKYRMDDPQTGRFWSVDPLASDYVHNSTYAFSENKVTGHIELEGLEAVALNENDFWRSIGISKNSDPIEFIKNVGKELLNPSNWFAASATVGQVAAGVAVGVMTEGIGTGTFVRTATAELKATPFEVPSIGSGTQTAFEARAAPNFIVDGKGTAYPVPEGSKGPIVADNGKGIRYIDGKGGVNGQVSDMRVMDPVSARGNAPGYPDGYIKYSNAKGQGVNPYTGKTGSKDATHFPINGNTTPAVSDATRVKTPIILPK